jgi:hypothetical protein
MKREIAEFVSTCLTCQRVKIEHQRPGGLLQPLNIPKWKWDSVTMDFVIGLPKTRNGKDAIWVIVDRLTKTARFVPIKESWETAQLAEAYVSNILKLHGVPLEIISDRDRRFLSKFWIKLQAAFGTKLKFSTTFHPATDGQTERTIQTLEDMLRACVIEFQGSWEKNLPMVEFAYNNSYHASIGRAPYEALYGRKCRSPLCWEDTSEIVLLGPEMITESIKQVQTIQEKLRTAQDRQKKYADRRRRALEFEVGDKVFLKITPVKGIKRFGKKGKLSPRYIGPYEILEKIGEVAYRLALPPKLDRVHNVFHVSQLHKYYHDPSHIIKHEAIKVEPNLSYQETPIKILDTKIRATRNKEIKLIKVLWSNHGAEEASWEAEDEIKNKYPHLFT